MVCWEGGEHSTLVILSVIAILLYPITYMVLTGQGQSPVWSWWIPPSLMIGIAAFGFGPLSVKSLGAEENGGRNGGRDWKHVMKSCGHEDMNHRKRQSISRGFCIDHLSGSFLIFYHFLPSGPLIRVVLMEIPSLQPHAFPFVWFFKLLLTWKDNRSQISN